MKEADKRARITVAYGGLVVLQDEYSKDEDHYCTRNNLFRIPKERDDDPELVKAIRSRGWQKPYVQRLVDAGLIVKFQVDSQDVYQPADDSCIKALFADHDNLGLRLSKFLFPSEAGLPAELAPLVESEPVEVRAEVKTDVQEGDTEETKFVVVKSFDMSLMLSALREMSDVLLDTRGKIEELNKPQPQKSTQADNEVIPYMRNRMKELDSRLSAMEQALKGQHSALALATNTLFRVDAGVQSLTSSVSATIEAVHKMNSGAIAAAVHNAVQKILGFSDAPKGTTLMSFMRGALQELRGEHQLRETLAELRAKLKDLHAVEELAMRAIEETEASQ